LKHVDRNISLYGEKIVSAQAMAHFEKDLIMKEPFLEELFMDNVAEGCLKILEEKVFPFKKFEKVVLLVGKGNNGADAYTIGALLAEQGVCVEAFALYKDTTPLSKKKEKLFYEMGGRVYSDKELTLSQEDLVIDGLLGTGYKGKIESPLKEVIDRVNGFQAFVFSIDIPSGVDGDSGRVYSNALYADMTAYLGTLKKGHLFEKGLLYSGVLHYVDFGLDCSLLETDLYLFNAHCLKQNLPKRSKIGNKYDVGQCIAVCGNTGMRGAAELSCKAAYRSGCGLVRHFYLGEGFCSMSEVISLKMDHQKFDQELYRTKALLIGPGLGREEEAKALVDRIVQIQHIPMVIDGDALFFLKSPPKGAILTPHRGELLHLLGVGKDSSEETLIKKAQEYCNLFDVIVVYKGVPTVIFSPNKPKLVIVSGNPGMSSGGVGDVLSGIIGSFLAQGARAIDAATLGVTVHGKAADSAANHLSEPFMCASDIIDHLSSVFLSL
jgi:NAD(P)H-hydrate epimerase